jgi:hypothetical protein
MICDAHQSVCATRRDCLKALLRCLLILAAVLFSSPETDAHIGSKNIFYEGVAGPYQLRVMIRPPEVVPGLAQITVRVHNGPISSVGALPVRWDVGRKGAPPPDFAKPVTGETNLYSTQLWIMNMGAYSVFVDVDGPLGSGTAIVPFNAISTRRLEMPRWMATLFAVVGVVLFLLIMAIVGAAARESVLSPSMGPGSRESWRGRFASLLTACLLGGALLIGSRWWKQVDRDFRNNRLFKPLEVASRLDLTNGTLSLDLASVQHDWRDSTPLVPDHGKLMHLFLVREPGMDSFAHLHPIREHGQVFEVELPRLPSGKYAVYADITHESGLSQTLQARVELPEMSGAKQSKDPDDTAFAGVPEGESLESKTDNGLVVHWTRPEDIRHDTEAILKFEVKGLDGKPAPLEPYMGMWAHLVVRSEDGTVFTHLHPAGTISMAAQELFARRERERSPNGKAKDVVCGRPDRELTFPYSFPIAGKYRLWLQTRANGQILTAPFDLFVQ